MRGNSLILRTYIIFQERENNNETNFVHGVLKKYVNSLIQNYALNTITLIINRIYLKLKG
jgi:hypothetical protein